MPWSLEQSAQFTADETYRRRVYQGFLKTANNVANEDPTTPERQTLAEQVINGSGVPPRCYELLPVLNPALQVEGGIPSDNDLLFTIAQQWDFFANQLSDA